MTTAPTVTEKLEEKVTEQAGLGTTSASLPKDTKVSPTNLTEQTNEIINHTGC